MQQQKVLGTVWEGEWPTIKTVVRTGRIASTCTYCFLHDALYFPGASAAMSNSLHAVDSSVHTGSLVVANYMSQTAPWLPSASVVVGASLLATLKSHHYWGPVAAGRNGLVTLTAASLFFFPNEIRAAVFGDAAPPAAAEEKK